MDYFSHIFKVVIVTRICMALAIRIFREVLINCYAIFFFHGDVCKQQIMIILIILLDASV